MAKAPKQISILCEDELAALPELVALAEKGHKVVSFDEFNGANASDYGLTYNLEDFDLILGKQCCMYQEKMEKYLPEMIKGARSRKYGPTQLCLEV